MLSGMRKKSIVFPLFLILVLTCFSCSVSGNSNIKLKPLEYDESLVYDIMIWDAPLHKRKTQEGFNEIAELGYNIIIPGFIALDFGKNVETSIEFLNRVHAAGLKTFVTDSDFCAYITQWDSVGERQPVKADTSNVKYYVDHPAFIGLHISDEPHYRHFDLLAKKTEQFRETFPEDKLVFINLSTRAAGIGLLGTDYTTYLQDMMEKVRPSILSYDHYPFDTRVGFWQDWFYSLEEVKNTAMEYNVPANMIMQVDGSANYDKRYCTLEEIRWQMAVIMAFGYESITHYSYSPVDNTHFGIVKDGQKTQLYYDIQTANFEVRKWDHVYKSFVHGYQGTVVVQNNRGVSDWKLDYFAFDLSIDDIPEIKFVESSEYLLIGCFKDNKGNAGFMITNATIPGEKKNAVVTMEFDEKYQGLQVYEKGEMDIVRLKDNKITFEIESSYGVFIIPLIAHEDSWEMGEDITVNFDLNYSSSTSPEPITVKLGQPYGELPIPSEREGYTFLGWRDGKTSFTKDITTDTIVEIDEDHTLYANWQGKPVTVSLNLNGGTYHDQEVINAMTVTVGETYNGLIIPSGIDFKREGYIFKGWYLSEDFSGPIIEPNTRVSITTNHTLHVKWETLRNSCDFESEGDGNVVYDVLDNLKVNGISVVEHGAIGNHMLKIDSNDAALHNSQYTVVSVIFDGFYLKPGQYLSFDIQSEKGIFNALQIFDAADNQLGDDSTWTGKHHLHTVTPGIKTIVVQPLVESVFFRVDLWWDYGWVFYIDNIRITDTDPRL
jgi:uncharacterized repeat protein (TIGR02543 family)